MKEHFAGDDRTNHERKLAGDLYIADDPEPVSAALRAVRLVDEYAKIHLRDNAAAGMSW